MAVALASFDYRLMAQSGDTTLHDELGVASDLTGGSPTLESNGGSDYAWQVTTDTFGSCTSFTPTATNDEGGITVAARIKVVSSAANLRYFGSRNGTNTSYGVRSSSSSSTALLGIYESGGGATSTSSSFTHGTGFVTIVVKLKCLAASTSDQVQVWHSSGGGTSAADLASSSYTASGVACNEMFIGRSGATIQVSDLVRWAGELSDADCRTLVNDGIRATLDGGGGGGSSIAAIFNQYNRLRRA